MCRNEKVQTGSFSLHLSPKHLSPAEHVGLYRSNPATFRVLHFHKPNRLLQKKRLHMYSWLKSSFLPTLNLSTVTIACSQGISPTSCDSPRILVYLRTIHNCMTKPTTERTTFWSAICSNIVQRVIHYH